MPGQQTENEFSIRGQSTRRDWFHSVNGGSPSVSRDIANGSEITGEFESNSCPPVDYGITAECVNGVCPVPWATTKASESSKIKERSSKLTNPKDMVGVRKAPMSTVPANVLAEIGVAMLEGSVKYGRHNYRAAGVRSSVYYDAVMRHVMSWWEGEDIDPDSNMSHITKALSCLTVLRDAQMQGMCTDDRPPKSTPFYAQLNETSALIIDTYSDKNPKHYTEID